MELLKKDFVFGDVSAINFVNCSKDEIDLILKMRNSDEVRSFMFTQHEISPNEHLLFIESLKERDDRLSFLVKDDDCIGVANLTKIDFFKKECFGGLYANPENPKKQKGVKLIFVIEKIAKELGMRRIFLEAYATNQRALRLYRDSGFAEIGEGCSGSETVKMQKEL